MTDRNAGTVGQLGTAASVPPQSRVVTGIEPYWVNGTPSFFTLEKNNKKSKERGERAYGSVYRKIAVPLSPSVKNTRKPASHLRLSWDNPICPSTLLGQLPVPVAQKRGAI